MAKWENSFDADDGGGGTTVNTESVYNDGMSSTESHLIDDNGNAYDYTGTNDTAVEDSFTSGSNSTALEDSNFGNYDVTEPNDYGSWESESVISDNYPEIGDLIHNGYNFEESNTVASNNYSEANDLMPNDYSSWQETNAATATYNPSETDSNPVNPVIQPEESTVTAGNTESEFTPVTPSENGSGIPIESPQEETNTVAEGHSTETESSEECSAVSNSSTIMQVNEPAAVLSNDDAETVNENPVGIAAAEQGQNSEGVLISAETAGTIDETSVSPNNAELNPISSDSSEAVNAIDTQQVMDNNPMESVNTAEEGLNSEENNSAALVQENTGTSGSTGHMLDTIQAMDDKPMDPVNKKEELISTETNNSAALVQEKDNTNGNIAHSLDTPQEMENNKEQINCKSESLKDKATEKPNNIEHKPPSPSERARMALFNKRKSSEDDFYNDSIGGTKKDILDKYTNKKPSSLVVASDTKGQDVTFDDFKVDGMDISIKREHDGYGNTFDSVRTIETVRLENGQVVKCNIQDMVGANAESKAFADEHGGMTLPDGKYYFTGERLEKQADGTYNSKKFANTLRLQTQDSNIPEHIRDDINSKYFLFHATEYKEGYIPKKGNRIWINPWSAGCISSITGGQATHDDFMNMLTGITPENISITITSKKHVNI